MSSTLHQHLDKLPISQEDKRTIQTLRKKNNAADREKLYQILQKNVGNTPLKRVPDTDIWVKKEAANPFGSHYDRVYVDLFKEYEQEKGISPDENPVLETTSGSAGVSFGAIANILGYEAVVGMPAGGEKAREEAIKETGAELRLTPEEQYVNAFPQWIPKQLAQNRKMVCLNHSMGEKDEDDNPTNNETTLSALEEIAHESIEKLSQKDKHLDIYMPGVGNGSTVLGPGRVIKNKTDADIIGYEPFQAAVAYTLLNGEEEFKERFGIPPGEITNRHEFPGLSYQGIQFPHIRNSIGEEPQEGVLDDVVLFTSPRLTQAWQGSEKEPHYDTPKNLPNYKSAEFNNLGRSTRAGIASALDRTNQNDTTTLVIGYDSQNRYDTP